ncbi:MAG: MBL fold metallo-hydrolase, partial [Actinobacteria bacterium]|nr:MBL fold metallo-hydrolase [Actinomycetota bacterium]NIV86482.1 MBL fold metallo-hydrolase [Actinomycetota bacterium]
MRQPAAGRVDRAPVDGIFLTHAHLGHYTGLAFFGFEAVHTKDLPVHATPAMADYLRSNGPWNQLVEIGNIRLVESDPSRPVELGQGVSVTPLRV